MSASTLAPPVDRTTTRPVAGRRALTALFVAALVAVAVAVGLSELARGEVVRVPVTFPGDPLAVTTDWGNLEHFGVEGSHVVVYRHDESTVMEVPWTGGPVIDAVLGDQPIHLLTVTEADVVGDALRMDVAFDNCRWFHERALDIFTELHVTSATGTRHTLALDRPILVHSPMLASCPDRTIDRGDDVRPSVSG